MDGGSDGVVLAAISSAAPDVPSVRDSLAEVIPLDRVERMLVEGVPTQRIGEVADELDARMIVMGSHGHRGLVHVLLGSTAERVARMSSIPVLIVKRPSDTPEGEE